MNRDRTVVRVVAVLFLAGGTVRLFANQWLFSLAGIGELWTDTIYFVYMYRVLGAFVVLTGLVLWSLVGDGGAVPGRVGAVKWGLGLVAAVMLVAGWRTGLPPRFYVVDVVFTAAVALLLHGVQRRSGRSEGEATRPGSSA